MQGEKHILRIHRSLSKFACLAMISAGSISVGQEPDHSGKKTTEPVFRVSKLSDVDSVKRAEEIFQPGASDRSAIAASPAAHPLDRAIEIAHASLANMQAEVQDYSAIMVKREQVNGVISDPNYMQLKVRCPRETEAGKTPFSIYMKFLKPRECAGRECIWVNGQNESKIVAHESGGLIGRRRFHLDPAGWLAMRDNRYPIYDAGLENLIIKLIEKAERDNRAGHGPVEYREGAVINKRPCTVIELRHDEKKAPYEFHKAQVFIDDEYQLPVRYAAYDWPSTPGGTPALLEEYTYVNLKLNVGLTAEDFNPDNQSYSYPGR
jgi:hypothetical protein